MGPCRDAAAVRAQLDAALAPTLAPGASWTVRARFARAAGRVTAYGEVLDASAATVASRSLSTTGDDCASLAKGLGVWASLVLDAEVDRASSPRAAEPADDPLAAPAAARAGSDASLWPKAHPPEPVSPEADLFLQHDKEARTVELGLSSFVMGGTGGGAIVGVSAYGVFEAAHGFFLRPALLGGHSVGALAATSEAPATFLASRFDACARLPGMYRDHRGLQLDLCAGAEVGFSLVDSGVVAAGQAGSDPNSTLPFAALGPSIGLRGELGSNLSAIIRGVGDISLLRESVTLATPAGAMVTPALFVGRAEVGLSWSLR